MILAILGKATGAIVFSGGSIVMTLLIIDEEMLGLYSQMHIYVTGGSSSNPASSINKATKDFQCKFKNTNEQNTFFKCEIFKLETSDSTKQHNIVDLIKKDQANVNNSDLSTSTNIFQINLISKYWSKNKYTGKTIEVKENEKSSILGNLTQLFSIYKNKQYGEIQHFLVQWTNSDSKTISTGKHKCSFIETTEDSEKEECEIFKFSDTNATSDTESKNLKFKGITSPSSTDTTITEHQYYVIKFTTATSKHKSHGINKLVIYDGTNTNTTAVFKNAKTAFYNTTHDHIFVM